MVMDPHKRRDLGIVGAIALAVALAGAAILLMIDFVDYWVTT